MEYYKGILPIYEKDSADAMSVQSFGYDSPANTWRYGLGLGHLLVIDFRPETLDPYIKDYVLTLMKLGMQTCYSCDGWHIRSLSHHDRMRLVFTDRYSAIWHSLLFDDAVADTDLGRPPFGPWKIWENDIRSLFRMLPSDEGKLWKYLQLKLITDYLNKHSAEYLGKLEKLRNTVNEDYPMIDSMSDEEVKGLFTRVFEEERTA